MNAVPYPVNPDAILSKASSVIRTSEINARLAQGIEALASALQDAAGLARLLDSQAEDSLAGTRHPGGWTTQVRFRGPFPFLDLHAPDDDLTLLDLLRGLLDPSVVTYGFGLPSDAIHVWLGSEN